MTAREANVIKAEVALIYVGRQPLEDSDRKKVRETVYGLTDLLMDAGCTLESFEWCDTGDALVGLSFGDKQATAALEVLRSFGQNVTQAVDGNETTRTFSPSIALVPA